MGEYLDRTTKEFLINLAGCNTLAQEMRGTEFRNKEDAMPYISELLSNSEKAIVAIMQGMNDEQLRAIINASRAYRLKALPACDPKATKEYYICPGEALDVLLSDVVSDCAFCMLEGKEMRRCKKRKALIECGIVANTDGNCPYSAI